MNKKFLTVSEVAKLLGIKNKKTGKFATYILRSWEKEFKSIKPLKLYGGRRYYDYKQIETIKKIKYLVQDKGLSIKISKDLLDNKLNKVDENLYKSINNEYLKNKILNKAKLIKNRVQDLKKWRKKVT